MAQRALLVGIDIYPYPPNNLNSCVNDTMAFRKTLTEIYGFRSTDITLLHNQDANYQNVTASMDALFASAASGDEIVYFQSSHGYQYPQGSTMVQVLCLYDKFLPDTELVSRTANLPSDVLTVVLDACHSGGMDKMFFPEGQPAIARAKVYQPTPEEQALRAGLTAQITDFKFFGMKSTASSGTIMKAFDPATTKAFVLADSAAKDPLDPELNGALFAACTSDQTAAAGSLATNNLSAFTFGLTTQLDPNVSLNDLCSMVGERLKGLNMKQTPIYYVPTKHQELATETFITMQTPTAGPSSQSGVAIGGTSAITQVINELRRNAGV